MKRNSVIGVIANFMGDIGRARHASVTYRELSSLSDASLAAKGIKRDEIAFAAFSKAFPDQ